MSCRVGRGRKYGQHNVPFAVGAFTTGSAQQNPVVVTQERPFPRVGLRDALLIAWDTAAIFYRTYVLRYYDRVGASLGRLVEVGPTAAERELGPPPAREIERPGS